MTDLECPPRQAVLRKEIMGPVTLTSWSERDGPQGGPSSDFFIPGSNPGIRAPDSRSAALLSDSGLCRRCHLQAFQQFAHARQHAILAEQFDILARHVIGTRGEVLILCIQ